MKHNFCITTHTKIKKNIKKKLESLMLFLTKCLVLRICSNIAIKNNCFDIHAVAMATILKYFEIKIRLFC